jgi:antibiotic biosynthesis monooxygenase (ABM) superfamily enzyme
MAHEALNFPGHQGVSVLRPEPGRLRTYTIVVHFRSRPELDAWARSEIRTRLLAEAEPLCEGGMDVQQVSGLEGWFQLPGSPVVVPPPKYKMAVVTWAAIFPLLVLANWLLVPSLAALPYILRLLIVSGTIIFLMTYVVMPQATQLSRAWLYREPPRTRSSGR